MKRFGCKELEYMISEVTFVDEKSLSWEMQAACGVSTVLDGGRLQNIEENALIRLCKSAKCSVLHVSCTRHRAS